jgi:DNA-binding PadR family transcriptional regulator
MKASRPAIEDLDPDKPITEKQYRYIKFCCADHLLRAESIARAVVGQDLSGLNQLEAHEVIQYLEKAYWEGVETTYTTDFEIELGKALTRVDQRSELITDRVRALGLLATNRVATPGQLARFVYGIQRDSLDSIRGRITPLLERMINEGVVGRAEKVDIPMFGKGAVTDVYYLTERGSDELHRVASQINYHARPGLPPANRLQHELAVTEARLDIQLNNHLEEYLPESKIRSEQEKERRKQMRANGADTKKDDEGGCGDFQAWAVDACTGEGRRIEAEVTIRARQREIADKPDRVKLWFTASQHRCDLIELARGEFAHLLPDFREPLDGTELVRDVGKDVSKWRTVGTGRLDRVRGALEILGGVATPEAVAAVAGLKVTTASEALACLADKGEVERRDGFPVSGKRAGRNIRIYHRKGMKIHSIFEFARLLTASKLVSARTLDEEFDRPLRPIDFDAATGVMLLLDESAPGEPVIAVVDDVTDAPERVVSWVRTALRQANDGTLRGLRRVGHCEGVGRTSEGGASAGEGLRAFGVGITQEQVVIVTSDERRAEALQAAGGFKVVCVGT